MVQAPPMPPAAPDLPAALPKRRVDTPTILQIEEVECGAAALAMILAYNHRYATLEELRTACGVSRDGSRADKILQAARGYGLEAHGYRMPFTRFADIQLPAIAFWRFSHWLVVEGFDDKHVYLNDPAEGKRTLGYAEFARDYSGIILTMKPGPDFKPGGQRYHFRKDLARRLQGNRLGLFLAVAAGLFLVAPSLVVPVFTTIFVDNILATGSTSSIGGLLLAMLFVAILLGGLTWLQQWFLLRTQVKMWLGSSFRFVRHLLQLPVEFFTQRYAGSIVGRLDDNDQLTQLLAGPLATAAISLIGLIFYIFVMAFYDVMLTIVGVLIALLNFGALVVVSRQRIDASRQQIREQYQVQSAGVGAIAAIETIKTSGSDGAFFARWAGFQAKSINASQRLGVLTNLLNAVPATLSTFNTTVILTVGGLAVMEGRLSLGLLVGFQGLMSSFLAPINNLVNLGSQLQTAQAQMTQVNDVLDNPADPTTQRTSSVSSARPSVHRLQGRLELRNVTFGYNRFDPPLIQGLSLSLEPGQRVALVGSTGSGKSTVIRLVTGLYQPWSGEILFDGIPRDQWPREVLSASIGMVNQEIMLFEGTVADNLSLWDRTIPEERLAAAAKDACIHEDIVKRTGGYQSLVSEGGRNFSGGQRQRLEIARVLALDPSILILDEATSALDTETEQAIDRNLRRRGVTCLIVAHRLSTIRDCDEILVLEEGKVVQRGTHDELLAAGGAYAELIKAE